MPMPLDGLPDVLIQYIESSAKSACSDPATVAMFAMASAGATIGNSRRIRLKWDWIEPALLFYCDICTSGGGKTPGFRAGLMPAMKAMERRENAWAEQDEKTRAEIERVIGENRTAKDAGGELQEVPKRVGRPRLDVDSATKQAIALRLSQHPRGLIQVKPELSDLLCSSQFKEDEPFYLRVHDCSRMPIDKVGNSDMSDDEKEMIIERPFLAVVGGVQWSKLAEAATEARKESGLFARFLFSAPPERTWGWIEEEPDGEVLQQCVNLYYQLGELKPEFNTNEPTEVKLSDGAKAEMIRYMRLIESRKQNAVTLGERLAWPKIRTNLPRLALIVHQLHVAANTPGVEALTVDQTTMKYAVRLAEWFGQQARRVYTRLALAAADERAKAVVKFLQDKNGATPRDLQNYGPRPRPNAEGARKEMHDLAARGLVEYSNDAKRFLAAG